MTVEMEGSSPNARRATLLRPLRRMTALVLSVLAFVLWLWGNMAVRNSNLPGETLRELAGWAFTLGSLGLFLFLPSLWKATLWFLGASVLLVLWWSFISASTLCGCMAYATYENVSNGAAASQYRSKFTEVFYSK